MAEQYEVKTEDGTFLCLRYSRETAEQAVKAFQPRWPGRKLIIVQVSPKETKR